MTHMGNPATGKPGHRHQPRLSQADPSAWGLETWVSETKSQGRGDRFSGNDHDGGRAVTLSRVWCGQNLHSQFLGHDCG